MRVYLDTNVLVSAFATRGLCADLVRIVLTEHHLVAGEAVLAEVARVLGKKFGVPAATVADLDGFLRRHADVVTDAPRLSVRMRDADDLAILSEAVAARADLLVTGDGDLLDLGAKAPLAIVSPRGFWELLRRGG